MSREEKKRVVGESKVDRTIPYGFLDEAASQNPRKSGSGVTLHISEQHKISFECVLGSCTNNSAEVRAASLLITIAFEESIQKMNIHGDSKFITDWMTGTRKQRYVGLYRVLLHAVDLQSRFQTIHFHHIYREHNQKADRQSKQACSHPSGSFLLTLSQDEVENVLHPRIIAI
jgi:ribonuclease HI